ncbi:MAG: hypothetical protein JMDDDDMK_01272 [Acidobacteria bacterium]|nr:hypothetical protein [Acidobacteriota bacterium]
MRESLAVRRAFERARNRRRIYRDSRAIEVAEINAGNIRARTRRDVRRIGRGLNAARRNDFTNSVHARPQIREAVIAAAIGRRGRVHACVGSDVESDRHARQSRLAAILHAVAVQVVEFLAADRDQLEVAEIHARYVHAGLRDDVRRIRCRLNVTGGNDFTNPIRARARDGEAVISAAAGGRGRVNAPVGVFVQIDRYAIQSRLAAVFGAVAVQVVEFLAADRHRREEIQSDHNRIVISRTERRGGVTIIRLVFGVVIEDVRLIGVDVPDGRAGDLRAQTCGRKHVIEPSDFAVERE